MGVVHNPRTPSFLHKWQSKHADSSLALFHVCVSIFLFVLCVFIEVLLVPLILEEHFESQGKASQVKSVINSLQALALFGLSPIIGWIADTKGRKFVFLGLLGCLFADLFFILISMASNGFPFLYIGTIFGSVNLAYATVAYAYTADISPAEVRTTNFGLLGGAFAGGFIVGPLMTGTLSLISKTLPLVVGLILVGFNILYVIFILPGTTPLTPDQPRGVLARDTESQRGGESSGGNHHNHITASSPIHPSLTNDQNQIKSSYNYGSTGIPDYGSSEISGLVHNQDQDQNPTQPIYYNLDRNRVNPLKPLADLLSAKNPYFLGLAFVYAIFNISEQAIETTVVLYSSYEYGFTNFEIGALFAWAGLWFVFHQTFSVRYLVPLSGERDFVTISMLVSAVSFIAYAFSSSFWVLVVALPFGCIGLVTNTCIQSLFSKSASEEEQGVVLGGLGSLQQLSTLLGVLIFPNIFAFAISPRAPALFPGAHFIAASAMLFMAGAFCVYLFRKFPEHSVPKHYRHSSSFIDEPANIAQE